VARRASLLKPCRGIRHEAVGAWLPAYKCTGKVYLWRGVSALFWACLNGIKMKTVNKAELFENLSGFLKSKGIELKDGSYTHRVQQGCGLLADAVNATQKTVRTARTKADQAIEKLRQSIHEASAPKPPPPPKSAAKAKSQARTKPKAGRKSSRQK